MITKEFFQALLFCSLLAFPWIRAAGSDPSPFPQNFPPDPPALVAPIDQSNGVPTVPELSVMLADPDLQPLDVTFYGRRKLSAADDFTIVGLPDTQYYSAEKNDGTRDIFYTQTQWITDNMADENIVFVSQLGDCVENGDLVEDEWKIADTAIRYIEDPLTTNLDDGIPYGIAVGNHDQTPFGDPDGTTALYNAYFGEARFSGRNYYGGHYGGNNDNHYQLFTSGGMDFIVIHLEYDPGADQDVLDWADALLLDHADRRAIIVSHFIIITGNPGIFGPQGLAMYNQFKDNSNVFLMLSGHVPGEGRRTDSFNGNTIHTLLADYQGRPFGGSGWLRLMKFSPVANTISVKTYSPWLDEWETDASSEFTLSYTMDDAGFKEIGTLNGISSGDNALMAWPGLDPETEYEWYAVADDGTEQVKSPVWSFTTGPHRLGIKVYLQGSWGGGAMSGLLADSIPLQQPYSASPWNYAGGETMAEVPSGMEDWVLVELRESDDPSTATGSTVMDRFAALLMSNGQVQAVDGSLPSFNHHLDQDLYVVVRHRNHLDIMSAEGLENLGGIFTFDFTDSDAKTYGGSAGIREIDTGTWGMAAGDWNGDGTVNADDAAGWSSAAGLMGYKNQDGNLDLQTDNRDKNGYWLINLDISSQVPE